MLPSPLLRFNCIAGIATCHLTNVACWDPFSCLPAARTYYRGWPNSKIWN